MSLQTGDCDDADAESNPGIVEVCDGTDNDCDGGVDELLSFTIWYQDLDGDSYGNNSISTYDCTEPQNYVADGGDCDDENVGVNPGIVEVCDGSDNNCDEDWD